MVKGALHFLAAFASNMGIDRGGRDVPVAEQFLDGADVVSRFQKLGGKGMAEGVAGDGFGDSRLSGRMLDSLL